MLSIRILFAVLAQLCIGLSVISSPVDSEPQVPSDVFIFDGKSASPHALPSMVLLEVRSVRTYVKCGGTLIHPKYILTAFSCVEELVSDAAQKKCTAHIGAHQFLGHDDAQTLDCWLSPQDVARKRGDTSIATDIALVHTITPAVLKSGVVSLAYLASAATTPGADHVYDGKDATIYGWGFRTSGKSTNPGVLQTLDGKVVPSDQCNYPGITSHKTMCVGRSNGKVGVATGDDLGGPVYVDHYQVGVMSRNPKGDKSKHVAVARVDYLRDWIDSRLKGK